MLKVLGAAFALILAAMPCVADGIPPRPGIYGATPQNQTPSTTAPPKKPKQEPQELNPYEVLADSMTDERQQSTINDHECNSTGTVDFEKFESNLSTFRDHWLSNDYSLDFYGHHVRQVLSVIIIKRLASAMTNNVYTNSPKVDCHFTVSVRYDDKYGQSHRIKVLTWTFTKEIASKTDWDKFDATKFNQIAQDWTYTKEVDDWTAEEPPLSDDGKRYPLHQDEETCSDLLFNANATFIRATTFCRKDYMDTKAGYTALAGSKVCFHKFDEATLKRAAMAAMKRLDEDVRLHGRSAACANIEILSREIDNGKR